MSAPILVPWWLYVAFCIAFCAALHGCGLAIYWATRGRREDSEE